MNPTLTPGSTPFSVIANPFDYSAWAFFVVHESGQLIGFSNSEEWCEQLIRTIR